MVRPDVPPAEPALDLRGIPGLTRTAKWMGLNLAFVTGTRLISAALAIGGPRVLCDKDLEIHDSPFTVREERIQDSAVAHTLKDTRDAKLLEALARLHDQRAQEAITVGVVYGAMHMPAVCNGLADRHGYRPRSAQWMTVVSPG